MKQPKIGIKPIALDPVALVKFIKVHILKFFFCVFNIVVNISCIGEWKYLEVAIKKIKTKSSVIDKSQLQQSLNELRYLNSCRHDNILPLYGYSFEIEPCLVYQFMSGGSLERRLYKSQNKNQPFLLSWENRLKIAIGTAK